MLDKLAAPEQAQTLSESDPAWVSEIAVHAKLMRAFRDDARLKAVIAEEMKKPSEASSNPKSASPLRLISVEPDAPEPLVNDDLIQEFVVLTKRQKDRRVSIKKLEQQILKAHPRTRAEALVFLDFLSRVVNSHTRLDRRAVSKAIRECAATMARAAAGTGEDSRGLAAC